ncbi:hypothetical protein [Actinosynnema sp. NPDC020468]|uniref:hypothetical protein n=1 Tax=Actinosynnema sp. NPDC020468 TaxID=3154488 RepID=UPI0033EFC41B
MNSRRDPTDGPDDVDATFAEIVAGLEREGVGRSWPGDHVDVEPDPTPAAAPPSSPSAAATVEVDDGDEPDDPDDHFVPPEPPPLPALRKGTIAALAVIVLGLVVLLFPGIFGLSGALGTTLALVVLCCGVGWLVLRIKSGPPPDSGWDDGAVL